MSWIFVTSKIPIIAEESYLTKIPETTHINKEKSSLQHHFIIP